MTANDNPKKGPTEVAAEVIADAFGADVVPITITNQDPEAAARRIAERMFTATSLDELYGASKGKSAEDVADRLIEVRDAKFQEYESQHGTIPLAVVTYYDEVDHKSDEFATAGVSLVPFLAMAKKLGEMPFKTRIVARRTKSGNDVLNFTKP